MEDNIISGDIRKGYFTELLLNGSKYINEPVASAIIYSIVLALWAYVAFLKIDPLNYIVPLFVFPTSFVLGIIHWRRKLKDEILAHRAISFNDIKVFIHRWFAGFDHQKSNAYFLEFLPYKKIDMCFPDVGEIRSIAKFNEWYEQSKESVKKNYHDIKQIKIDKIQNESKWEVSIDLTWESKNKEGLKSSIDFHQDWIVELDKNMNLKIIKHRAESVNK
jgi:hypothetical protein